jgi:hypothetical protein
VSDPNFTRALVWAVFGTAIATFVVLVFVIAPYTPSAGVACVWGAGTQSHVMW